MINGDIMQIKYRNPENQRYFDMILHVNEKGKPEITIYRGGKHVKKIDETKEYDDFESALRELKRKEKRRLQRGYERVS